jgi:hypothetical protein
MIARTNDRLDPERLLDRRVYLGLDSRELRSVETLVRAPGIIVNIIPWSWRSEKVWDLVVKLDEPAWIRPVSKPRSKHRLMSRKKAENRRGHSEFEFLVVQFPNLEMMWNGLKGDPRDITYPRIIIYGTTDPSISTRTTKAEGDLLTIGPGFCILSD